MADGLLAMEGPVSSSESSSDESMAGDNYVESEAEADNHLDLDWWDAYVAQVEGYSHASDDDSAMGSDWEQERGAAESPLDVAGAEARGEAD